MIKLYKNEWVYQFSNSRMTVSVYATDDKQPEPYPEHLTDLKLHTVEQGYFLTEAELEQRDRRIAEEAWEQGRKKEIIPAHKVDLGNGRAQLYNSKQQTFADYWAEKKKEIEG